MRVLERLARAYAGTAGAHDALDFLACADLPAQPAPPPSSRLVRLPLKAVELVRDALSKPPRVAEEEATDELGYGFHLHGLSTQGTRDATGGGGGATREVLVAALHLAIARWNSRHEVTGRRIGVLVPVDLRPAELPEHVVANLSVNTRLSTTPRERLTPTTVLRAIKWHSERDEATRTGISLIAALQRAGMLALWAKQSSIVLQPLTGNQRADAAMLCDLGSFPAAPSFGGDAGEVTELWFSPPSRSLRCLCVGDRDAGGAAVPDVPLPARPVRPERGPPLRRPVPLSARAGERQQLLKAQVLERVEHRVLGAGGDERAGLGVRHRVGAGLQALLGRADPRVLRRSRRAAAAPRPA